jgi:glycogen operon protein
VKNFLTVTMLSLGMPMMLMGDEVRRTQGGNNNAYCQDSETSWFDWSLVERHADLHRFVKLLIARRLLRDTEHERRRLSLNRLLREAEFTWHGVELGRPDWRRVSRSVAFTAKLRNEGMCLHLILNAYWEPLDFALPPGASGGEDPWRRWIDTALDSPHDIVEWQASPVVTGSSYHVRPRSLVVLISWLAGSGVAPGGHSPS